MYMNACISIYIAEAWCKQYVQPIWFRYVKGPYERYYFEREVYTKAVPPPLQLARDAWPNCIPVQGLHIQFSSTKSNSIQV